MGSYSDVNFRIPTCVSLDMIFSAPSMGMFGIENLTISDPARLVYHRLMIPKFTHVMTPL